MQFKTTENLKSGKKYYYVDGKKVVKDIFDIKQIVCERAGMKYNSSRLETKGNFRYSYCSYD